MRWVFETQLSHAVDDKNHFRMAEMATFWSANRYLSTFVIRKRKSRDRLSRTNAELRMNTEQCQLSERLFERAC
jgi:hypothetical protein